MLVTVRAELRPWLRTDLQMADQDQVAAPEEVRVSESETVLDLARVFASQADAALRLRSSTAAERIAKIKKLRDAVLAKRDEW